MKNANGRIYCEKHFEEIYGDKDQYRVPPWGEPTILEVPEYPDTPRGQELGQNRNVCIICKKGQDELNDEINLVKPDYSYYQNLNI